LLSIEQCIWKAYFQMGLVDELVISAFNDTWEGVLMSQTAKINPNTIRIHAAIELGPGLGPGCCVIKRANTDRSLSWGR
jgi:hypothetical protein